MPERFDVFLSHNSKDKKAVRELSAALRGRGLAVWLDEDSLDPGALWQEELEAVIRAVPASLVAVGGDGLGPWENLEMRGLLDQLAKRKALVVPILLPGAPRIPEIPLFLGQLTWLDLRGGLAAEALDRLAAAIRKALPKRQKPRASRTFPESPDLKAYRAWARDRTEHVPLIGVGGGDFRLRFEEIYVPLRLALRWERLEARDGKKQELRMDLEAGRDLRLEDLFGRRKGVGPHAVVLGHPGAGKTTVLRKIEHLCLSEGPAALGLPQGTVPFFLRLRGLAAAELALPPDELLTAKLAAEAGEALPPDFGGRLWRRGGLLLLLDGLDEIGDAVLRAEVCRYLERHLPAAEGRGIVAALSCRLTGWGGAVGLPHPRFREVEVCPLDAEGCERLVRVWYAELARAHPELETEAERGRRELLAALGGADADFRTQRLKVLVGSPLLLTLLCLIVLRGRQMPRHRWAFYDECLRVLLGHWGHGKAVEAGGERRPPPLDVETALATLRPLAWELHKRGKDMPRALLIARLARLRQLGAAAKAAVFEWLLREAGVLGELSGGGYGFRHLGLEEYLAARHVASAGPEELEKLAALFGMEGWREIPLLVVGLPDPPLFVPFLRLVLKGDRWPHEVDLLRACLEEGAEVDLAPFLELLEEGGSAARQAAVLRLLLGRKEARLLELADGLRQSADADVAALAREILRQGKEAGAAAPLRDLFVLWDLADPRDREAGVAFVAALAGQGLKVASPEEEPEWEEDVTPIVSGHRALALVAGPGARKPWEDERLAAWADLFEGEKKPVLALWLPGSGGDTAWPEGLLQPGWIDLRGGFDEAAREVGRYLWAGEEAKKEEPGRAAAPAIVATRPVAGEAWVEAVTGIRFLWVPGDRFRMGGKVYGDEKPIHWVRLSPYWLGETPVTNGQYGKFLESTGHPEPGYWRDRRFSGADLPVVGVTWHDAVAYCRWLSGVAGWEIKLPSEAQWEFAARGTGGREYPWGDEDPDETRAKFGDPGGEPVAVGKYPEGRGPFGHLDLAGNVWEWCEDAWDAEAYAKRAKGPEPLDPVVQGGVDSSRIVRGGAFWGSAELLRAACRRGSPASGRSLGYGFRAAAAAPRAL